MSHPLILQDPDVREFLERDDVSIRVISIRFRVKNKNNSLMAKHFRLDCFKIFNTEVIKRLLCAVCY